MLMEQLTMLANPFYKGLTTGDWKGSAADVKKGVAIFEEELGKRDSYFFGGEKPMNIDFCIWPHLERLEVLKLIEPDCAITSEEFPRMHQLIARIMEVPAVKETIVSPEMHMKLRELRKVHGHTDYDFGLIE